MGTHDTHRSIRGGHVRGFVSINIVEISDAGVLKSNQGSSSNHKVTFPKDRRTRVCLSGGERLMMLNAVINGSEAFVVEQDLQGKMMAAFVGGKKGSEKSADWCEH
ncbi:hypothetical protein F2P79_025301 [Pimephales promelas]|nr:hypothetical protein F2P79_025301 [Pimephales promelas]